MQRRLFWLLIKPSFASSLVCSSLTILWLGVSVWEYLTQTAGFYDYFFGPSGIGSAINLALVQLGSLVSPVLADTWVYNTVIALAAFIVALGVYVILQQVSTVLNEVAEASYEARLDGFELHKQIEKTLGRRVLLRFVIGIAWVLYGYISLLLIPLALLIFKQGLQELPGMGGLLYCGMSVLTLFVILHIHTVLMRAFVLRPRVFGGYYQIMNTL